MRGGIQVQLLLILKSNFFIQCLENCRSCFYKGSMHEHLVAGDTAGTMLNKYLVSLKKKHTRTLKTWQSAESYTPRSLRVVIINSWIRHCGLHWKTRGEVGRFWLWNGEGKLKQRSYFRGQNTARQNQIEPSRAGAFCPKRKKKSNTKTARVPQATRCLAVNSQVIDTGPGTLKPCAPSHGNRFE